MPASAVGETPEEQQRECRPRKAPRKPFRVGRGHLEHRHHHERDSSQQNDAPADKAPAKMDGGQLHEGQRRGAVEGDGQQRTETDRHTQTDQRQFQAENCRVGRRHAVQGVPRGNDKQPHTAADKECGQPEGERLVAQKTGGQQHCAKGNRRVNQGRYKLRSRDVRAGHHRKDLEHCAEHHLQHETYGYQVRHRKR